jgi:hypothetical protein
MRFLLEAPETREAAAAWSKDKTLLFADCFFWSAGTEIQRSFSGLLRSLLHALLEQAESLIPEVAEWRWRAADLGLMLPPWSDEELEAAFTRLVETASSDYRLCIFIDGLDEFEGDFNQLTALVKLLLKVSGFESVKICVSSRPWPVFRNELEDYPHLRLEDLTRNDIQVFVNDGLGKHKDFASLRLMYPQRCDELVLEVVDKAQGVFLWVYLVVRSLSQGLTEGDPMDALTRRLREIPPDLDEFLLRIINGIPPAYRTYATKYFNIMLTARGPMELLVLFFVEEADPEPFQNTPYRPAATPLLQARKEAMIRRLESRCRGLLETNSFPNTRPSSGLLVVDFLHRSVQDFLRSNHAREFMHRHSDPSFDMDDFMCKAILARLKVIEPTRFPSFKDSLFESVVFHAQNLERSSGRPHPVLLETIGSLLEYHNGTFCNSLETRLLLGLTWRLELVAVEIINNPSLAVNNLLYEKVIPWGAANKISGTLLFHALFNGEGLLPHDMFRLVASGDLTTRVSPPLTRAVCCLLERGADPNANMTAGTIWQIWLRAASLAKHQASRGEDDSEWESPAWAETARALITHGAAGVLGKKATHSGNVRIGIPPSDREYVDIPTAVENIFEGRGGKEMADLLRKSPRRPCSSSPWRHVKKGFRKLYRDRK